MTKRGEHVPRLATVPCTDSVVSSILTFSNMGYKNLLKRRKYGREWVAKRRAVFFQDKTCLICGSKERLRIHHVKPSEKIAHQVWSWSEERRKVELEKCIIVCKTCHGMLHNTRDPITGRFIGKKAETIGPVV